jgi:DNA polymerase-3 subunit delta'
MFENFHGNPRITGALTRMIDQDRIAQTLLLAGPEGVGKATLARRLAAALIGDADKIEQDDLSLPHNVSAIEEREKWPAERRSEDPLLFASQLDFVTFPPDGPLRQLSIQQMRLLKDRARFRPQHGSRRVFLIDHLDRANEQAANSLLKTLEEPPDHLILVLTAENAQDLLPTIRSRAIQFHLGPLSQAEMAAFVGSRKLDQPERRIRLAAGSPGRAVSMDLEDYDRRKTAMLALLEAASGATPFAAWLEYADSVSAAREEKLDLYLSVLYGLLQDLLAVQQSNGDLRNPELAEDLTRIAQRVSFQWVRAAVRKVDELVSLLRRNIQKSIALDALILDLRASMKIA